MRFHSLAAEQSPGWAGCCVLSTGRGELQPCAQKFALQDDPTLSSLVSLQQTGLVYPGEANVVS